jgi:hypothetical protein
MIRLLVISAVALLFSLVTAQADPVCIEPVSEQLARGLEQAGRICLSAGHEKDVAPAIDLLKSLQANLIAKTEADASRVDSAWSFVLKWQSFLAYCETENRSKARATASNIANLPIAHLMMRRSEICKRLAAIPVEGTLPLAAPFGFQESANENGSVDVVWHNAADDAENCVVEKKDGYGGWKSSATLPPNTENYHFPAPEVASAAEIREAVQRAAASCLSARGAEELDPTLTELARYWRGARSDIAECQRAEQSRIDCTLMFVCWWQDSLNEQAAGNKRAAAKRLRRLAATSQDYPVLPPQVILQRASAIDPDVGDFEVNLHDGV